MLLNSYILFCAHSSQITNNDKLLPFKHLRDFRINLDAVRKGNASFLCEKMSL